jgi:predicted Zn-dependent protease
MSTADHILSTLRAAVDAARAAGAADAEASFEGGRLGFTRFASSTFTQAGVVDEPTVRVRAMTGDGRIGAAVASSLDPTLLAATARRALEAAAAAPPPRARLAGFARPDAGRTPYPARFAAATAAAGPGERADGCARLFARAARERLQCAGLYRSGTRELATVTAGGVAAHAAFTEVALDCICLDETDRSASGFSGFAGPDLAALDTDALADDAIWRAVRAREGQRDVPPGAYDVVLGAPAVAEALEWLSLTSLGAKTLLDETSLLTGRAPGSALVDERITLEEHPGYPHPALVTIPIDAEGTTRVPVRFIDAGRAGRAVTDLHTAATLGDARGSTGHAPPLGTDLVEGPGPAHLVLHPGDASLDELIGRVERGLYVTRFHYVNGFLDTRRATMTGMTRDGLFVIEDGRITGAARPLRWTDSLLDALAHRLGGIGSELSAARTSWSSLGHVLCPPLLLRAFRFTGTSR